MIPKFPKKIYLDDERPCPPGWILAKSAQAAICLLQLEDVEEISLDHDLGDEKNGTGNDVLLWIEERVHTDLTYDPPFIFVHSSNASAVQKMKAGIQAIEKYVTLRPIH